MNNFWDKPCAAGGLNSYRYRGRYSWVMIGAKNDSDAMREAARSVSGALQWRYLEVWDGTKYVPVAV